MDWGSKVRLPLAVEDVIRDVGRRYGKPVQVGKSRVLCFGSQLTCSINYSKVVRGNKFFFGLSREVVDSGYAFPETSLGDFVLLVCGSAEKVVVMPRSVVLGMMKGVPTRRLDVFVTDSAYIFQTTGYPKLDVTEHLNAFPSTKQAPSKEQNGDEEPPPPRGLTYGSSGR